MGLALFTAVHFHYNDLRTPCAHKSGDNALKDSKGAKEKVIYFKLELKIKKNIGEVYRFFSVEYECLFL